ncbi:OprD family outer membrane porin [Arundinibacter roseus]|uniref:Outer membrane porin, OprD family n=1 Tax=Arundinibacter roseus TaxID=2070510 RepID=A0A4R4KG85_9BACT|nr:OprD family outer membrane porin [Arundinibacter roseus]TDB65902.1 outer membrane porin, OprD family [Arundinibacter roseus]
MKYTIHILFLLVTISLPASGQGIHSHQESEKDTNTLNHFFEKGRFYGHARSYFSATVNQKELMDSYALGVGAGIGYETPIFLRHFQLGISGFFMFNVLSSDLAKRDPATAQGNRYEVGLFDIEQPDDHEDLDRLEELFAKVHLTKKTFITVGRQIPASPFINPQDGRMRPTLTEAAVLEVKEGKHWSFQGQYIWRISPRSTVRWFKIGESMGIYPVGVHLDGSPSAYKEHVESNGIILGGFTFQKNHWNVQIWDTHVDNVLNTGMLKVEWKSAPGTERTWMSGLQLICQQAAGNGGNEDPARAYTQPGSKSTVISGRIGQQSTRFDWYLNATRITAEGRFLMPREWGREPFYTFMPRERNEGAGDVSAATLNMYFKPEKHIKLEVSGGMYRMPDVRNAALNKYGLPSYAQVNLGLTYQFDHYLKGLNALLLVVRKDQLGETYQNDRFVFNKVNMTHFNFILNYHY